MKKRCEAFDMKNLQEAWEHLKYEIVKDYGNYAYGHYLHTWDDGERMLAKCKTNRRLHWSE